MTNGNDNKNQIKIHNMKEGRANGTMQHNQNKVTIGETVLTFRENNEQINKIINSHACSTQHTTPPNEDHIRTKQEDRKKINNREINAGRQNAFYISAAPHHQQEQRNGRHITTITEGQQIITGGPNNADETQGEYVNMLNDYHEYALPGRECPTEKNYIKTVMTSYNQDDNRYTDGHGN